MADEQRSYDYFNISFPLEYVAHVEINRPQKLNAFIEVMWLNLSAIINRLSHHPNVRAILLTGTGNRAFTAGLDVQAASTGSVLSSDSVDVARKANAIRRHILEFQGCISSAEKCEVPIITLLHGISFGLALDLSLATDIRLAVAASAHGGEATRFCVKEVDIGLAADIGTLSRLPKAVGNASWVKEVSLTAREFGAEEALQVGLVSRVVGSKEEGVKEGLKIAAEIARKSPVAVIGTKAILNWSRDHGVDDGLQYTAAWNAAMVQTKDVKDAMMAGLQRRKPTFEKL